MNWLGFLIIGVLVLYLLLSIFVFFFANSNIIPNRRHREYSIDIPAQLDYFTSTDSEREVAFWKATQDGNGKSVILMHGFTRDAGVMNKRANIYWEEGYNVYLVDNLGHGKSSSILFPSGIRYCFEVMKLIELENLKKPILHGASMGAIAASCIAQIEKDLPEKIVTEALPINFNNLYKELLRYVKIPFWLFPWIESVSRAISWRQFKDLEWEYQVDNITCPMFQMHSASDRLFKPEDHYYPIKDLMSDRKAFDTWLVPNAGHTRLDSNEKYKEKLLEFINGKS